ncbi:hypothetical protein [Bradyrhizobium cytisi]|uniref:hypothetical protein n=1 Tax=Bradyrhizobium cytisi TaxID=515489 RepID=UPI001652E7E7|nr:hypothetical protein [Bradyrhizobium cytisi]
MRNKPFTAFHLDAVVTLAAGVHCPHCGTELRAQDVELLDRGEARFVCSGCHLVISKIESR